MAKRKTRVFVADDHPIMRKAIIDQLKNDGLLVVGEAGTVAETLGHCFDEGADVVLLDLNMDTTSGITTIETLLEQYEEAKIVVFSFRESLTTISATYKAGAKGYLTKSAGTHMLAEAIERVASGHNYYMPGMAEKLMDFEHEEVKEKDPREELTEKELEIFTLLAEGKDNEQVAEELKLTEKSVANRALEIRRKLGIRMTSFEWVARKYDLLKLDL